MYYTIEEMSGYYRIGSPEGVFCYVITGQKKAMLIDTGYAYGDLKAAVHTITEKPLYIVNTHGHFDHTGGNAQFDEAVYIHKDDMELCRNHTSEATRKESIERAKHSLNYETGKEYYGLPENFNEAKYCTRGAGNLSEVKEGALFDLGGVTMEILETPGHTRGGISVWYKEKDIIFIGDAIGPFVWLFSEETTSREIYIQSLKKLDALSVNAFIGGHNPKIMTKKDLQLYIRAAREADYAKGFPFRSFLSGEEELHVCALDGMTLEDMFKPGFAALVLSKGK